MEAEGARGAGAAVGPARSDDGHFVTAAVKAIHNPSEGHGYPVDFGGKGLRN